LKEWGIGSEGNATRFDYIRTIIDDAQRDLIATNAVFPCPVYTAVVPFGYVNAYARTGKHGVLVLLNYGMLHLIYQVAKVFVWSLDWIQIDEGDGNAISIPENQHWTGEKWTKDRSVRALADIFVAYFTNGSPTMAPRQVLPQDERLLWLSTLDSFGERFILLHEYAHVLLCHSGPQVIHEMPNGNVKEFCARSRQQEDEADLLAASIFVRSCDLSTKEGQAWARFRIAGIALVFACNLLHDVIRQGPKAFLTTEYATHSSAHERLMNILAFIKSRYNDPRMNLIGGIVAGWATMICGEVAELAWTSRGQFKY
jgi:hypothetical protein